MGTLSVILTIVLSFLLIVAIAVIIVTYVKKLNCRGATGSSVKCPGPTGCVGINGVTGCITQSIVGYYVNNHPLINYSKCVDFATAGSELHQLAVDNKVTGDGDSLNTTRGLMCAPWYTGTSYNSGDNTDTRKYH